MFRKINRVLRTAILITGAGVLLAKLAEKDPQQEEEQSMEGNHREKDAFQEKEFDDIWQLEGVFLNENVNDHRRCAYAADWYFLFYQPGTDIPGDRVCHLTGDGSEWPDPHLRVYDVKRFEQQG